MNLSEKSLSRWRCRRRTRRIETYRRELSSSSRAVPTPAMSLPPPRSHYTLDFREMTRRGDGRDMDVVSEKRPWYPPVEPEVADFRENFGSAHRRRRTRTVVNRSSSIPLVRLQPSVSVPERAASPSIRTAVFFVPLLPARRSAVGLIRDRRRRDTWADGGRIINTRFD